MKSTSHLKPRDEEFEIVYEHTSNLGTGKSFPPRFENTDWKTTTPTIGSTSPYETRPAIKYISLFDTVLDLL
jgi:hypothetical protein